MGRNFTIRARIPVYRLYGEVAQADGPRRRDRFDVILVDLQEMGGRIDTFITTLGDMLEAGAT